MNRRRALISAEKESYKPITLYKEGVISEFAGGLNNNGYEKNPSYNKATQESEYLSFTCTSSSTGGSVLGGRAFTFNKLLTQKCLGRNLHVKFTHKNTSSVANDQLRAIVAPTVVTASTFEDAYPQSIYQYAELGKETSHTEHEVILPITKTGYVSIAGHKVPYGGGTYEIHVTEVWIE